MLVIFWPLMWMCWTDAFRWPDLPERDE